MTTLFCAQYWGTDTSSFHLYLHLYYCNNFWTSLLYRLHTTTTVINDLKYTKCLFCQAVLLGAEDTVMESDTTPAFKELRLVQEKEKTNHVISDSRSATKTLPQSKNKKKQGKRQGLSEVTSTWHLTSDSLHLYCPKNGLLEKSCTSRGCIYNQQIFHNLWEVTLCGIKYKMVK